MTGEDKMRLGIERKALEEVFVEKLLYILQRQMSDQGALSFLRQEACHKFACRQLQVKGIRRSGTNKLHSLSIARGTASQGDDHRGRAVQ